MIVIDKVSQLFSLMLISDMYKRIAVAAMCLSGYEVTILKIVVVQVVVCAVSGTHLVVETVSKELCLVLQCNNSDYNRMTSYFHLSNSLALK